MMLREEFDDLVDDAEVRSLRSVMPTRALKQKRAAIETQLTQQKEAIKIEKAVVLHLTGE